MSPAPNLFLIGPMGAGKSAVGKHLARLLHREFLDSDSEIERRTGVDIPFIFEKEGEAGFRKREKSVIEELTRRKPVVIATGGGAVMDPDNRSVLASRGTVVYLHASVEQQIARTRHSRNRPLLQTDDPERRLRDLMEQREPAYRDLADHVVDTDGRRVGDVAREIWRLYQEDENAGG